MKHQSFSLKPFRRGTLSIHQVYIKYILKEHLNKMDMKKVG